MTLTFPARRGLRVLGLGIAAVVLLAAVAPGLAGQPAQRSATHKVGPLSSVIVQSRAGTLDARDAVVLAGGTVTRDLPIVEGVAADVPVSALADLIGTPGLLVSPDERVAVQASASSPGGIESVYRTTSGGDDLQADGFSGAGITVALVDTGVTAVPDLAGRLVSVRDDLTGVVKTCVNLSGESGCNDTYGHGTFMAGIIAGSGAASGGVYRGMAPASRIVSIKIAGKDGAADVSTVLAAVQWVVSFKDRYGIRLLNLSLGTNSTQTYRTDPLNYAVERAWDAGVAVVVSAANNGPAAGTISKPGDDPWVITVGSIDDRGTPGRGDDHLPDFSSRGPTAADGLAKPDLMAPGAHVVSLSAPGSAIAQAYPSTMGGGYRKGSGTSMAAAVVTGAAAQLLSADASLTPDRLKFALMESARPTADPDPMLVGAGLIDAPAALSAPAGTANQGLDRSSGLGSLDASRGTVRVQTLGLFGLLGTLITGLQTAQLLLWDPISFVTGSWSAQTWYLSPMYLVGWNAVTWEGGKWQGGKWQGGKWQGGKWQGVQDESTVYGGKWQGSAWYGAWQ